MSSKCPYCSSRTVTLTKKAHILMRNQELCTSCGEEIVISSVGRWLLAFISGLFPVFCLVFVLNIGFFQGIILGILATFILYMSSVFWAPLGVKKNFWGKTIERKEKNREQSGT